MALPKKKHTKGARNQRRSHDALSKMNFSTCPKCGKAVLAHIACPACGMYKNRQVLDIEAKAAKKAKKEKERKKDNR